MARSAIFLFCLILTGCSALQFEEPPSDDVNSIFRLHSKNFVKCRLAFHPVQASLMGVHDFDGDLPDYSPKSVEAELVRIEGFRQILSNLPAGRLNNENLVDWEILEGAIQAIRSQLTEKPDFKRDPLFYNNIIVLGLETLLYSSYAPPSHRMNALLSRLEKIPEFLEIARINLTQVPEKLRAEAEKPLINSMYMLRNTLPGRVRAQLNGDLPKGFETIHLNAIYAYTDFVLLFVKETLKKSAIQECAIGEALYFKRWDYDEALRVSDNDVDTLLEFCEKKRENVLARMGETASLVDPDKELGQVLRDLEKNPPSLKTITDWAAKAAGDLKEFTAEKELADLDYSEFKEIRVLQPDPRLTRRVIILTQGLRSKIPTKGFIAINPLSGRIDPMETEDVLRFYTEYKIALLTAGAGYPGNYVQTVIGRRTKSVVRKTHLCDSAIQGWAQYCWELVMDKGYDPRPEALLSLLSMNLLQINRLETSAKLHCNRLSFDEAVNFLAKESFISLGMARNEVIQILRQPKAGAGVIGKAQIIKLRDLYLEESEDNTLQDFHELLLSEGLLPIPLIGKIVFNKKI